MMKKTAKGDIGYIRFRKKQQVVVNIILFAIPLLIFFTGIQQTGSRLNLFTFVAILGSLPACRAAVHTIMILMRKNPDVTQQSELKAAVDGVVDLYDLTFTAYEKNTPVDAMVVCGNTVIGYTPDENADLRFIQSHLQKMLKQNGYGVSVKIFTDPRTYKERIYQLNQKKEELEESFVYKPDERYPDLSGSELVKYVLLALSL